MGRFTMDDKMELNLSVYSEDGKQMPFYATNGSYCFDVYVNETVVFNSMNEVQLVGTGLYFDIPDGYGLTMHPRSGLATKHGIAIANMTGIVDADYTDELLIPLVWACKGTKYMKDDSNVMYVHRGSIMMIEAKTRVVQLALVKKIDHGFLILNEKPAPKRSRRGGFGSTGLK